MIRIVEFFIMGKRKVANLITKLGLMQKYQFFYYSVGHIWVQGQYVVQKLYQSSKRNLIDLGTLGSF